jgi:hypothetical protein
MKCQNKREQLLEQEPIIVGTVRKLGNFQYILIPEIINKFMTNISDPWEQNMCMCSS